MAVPATGDRYLAVDDEGRGLRATWRPAHGFVNISLWRGTTCVETFHLTPEDASDLVAFLVAEFAAWVPRPGRPNLRAVGESVASAPTGTATPPVRFVDRLRGLLADSLGRAARSLRP